MHMRILIAAAALALVAMPAWAKQIRFPEEGDPAITAEVLDAWKVEKRNDGNLHISSIDRNLEVLFSIVPFDGTLDEAATAAMKANAATAPGPGPEVEISGQKGRIYYSLMAGDNGHILNMKMVVVRLDAQNMGLFTIISDQKVNDLMLRAAQAIVDSVKIAPPQ